jgi:hypothetical protein
MPSVALTAGELDAFRGTGHATRAWLSAVPATTLATARINQTTFSNPVTQITVDGTSAAWLTDVRQGHTVWIGTTAGARDIGVYRVRATPGATTLYIAELSSGDPGLLGLATLRPLADNAYVTVVQDWNLWSVFPRISGGVFYKDFDETYGTQNELGGAIPGYINMGGQRRGRMSGSTISFDFEADPQWFEVIGTDSVNWTFENGTPSTATGVGPHTVSFPAGIHAVTCTATSDNGGTAQAVRFVFAHDFDSNPPYSVKVLSDRVTKQGRRLSLEIIGADLNDTVLQTGTLVLLWEELYFENGDSLDSATADCVGWVESVSGGGDSDVPVYRVEVIQALHRLEQIRGFSQVLTATANPANWQEVSPTLCHFNFYVFYLLYWHTTLLQLFDYHAQSFVEVTMNTWANDPGDWYSTVNRLGAFVMAEWTQASDGTLYLRRKPHLMGNSERNALAERVTLDAGDLAAIPDMERRQYPEVGQTQAFAFTYNVITGQKTGLKSYAPGEVPGQGGRTESMPDQWVINQDDLNVRASNYHAMVNNPYPRVSVQLLRSNAVNALLTAPAEMYWVVLDLTADTWPEGTAFDSRCVVEDISINWNEDGTKDAALNLIPETNGSYAPAQTMPVTIDNETDPTTVQFPSIDPETGTLVIPYDTTLGLPPVNTPLVTEDEQVAGVLFAWSANAVGVSYNPAAPDFLVFWTPPAGETIQSLVYDRRSPRFTTDKRRGALRLWILTDAALYYCANALAASPTVVEQQVVETFNLLRAVNGVADGIGAYGLDAEYTATGAGLTFDGGSDLSYTITRGTVSSGGRSGNCMYGTSLSGAIRTEFRIDLGVSTTVTSITLWVYVVYAQPVHTVTLDLEGFQSNGTTLTGTLTGQHPTTTDGVWTELTYSVSWANTRYIEIALQDPTFWLSDIRVDDIVFNANITATGAAVLYSDDTGTTITTIGIGSGSPSTGGYDSDDFNLGCHIASNDRYLYFTTTYDGTATLMATVDAGTATINLVRIPQRILTGTTYNNSSSALHFIYGMDAADGSGRTLVRGVFNRGTNSVTLTDITPVVSATTYRPVGPESLETYAGDARVMLLLAQPVGGGATVRLRSTDAGATWALAGTNDFTFVRWTGRTRAWFGGEDGIGFTSDRGVSLDDRDGDYELVVDDFPIIGVEAI